MTKGNCCHPGRPHPHLNVSSRLCPKDADRDLRPPLTEEKISVCSINLSSAPKRPEIPDKPLVFRDDTSEGKDRKAQALKANLTKRKQQQRARSINVASATPSQ